MSNRPALQHVLFLRQQQQDFNPVNASMETGFATGTTTEPSDFTSRSYTPAPDSETAVPQMHRSTSNATATAITPIIEPLPCRTGGFTCRPTAPTFGSTASPAS
ncbi:hypothetical protein CDD80_4648 [Ophiocordyceps camponoti-rufipedis]|uniref:Uncharacterized protein n=1 Tax=Ophiocordyceps camponoti-rufipedis TaxID=2004952 RepID=A0A2C5Y2E3_9HYPO|nr:hypothetical protein CDD80_4648 [Ophiocordyceps camponoti-rufipedis]